MRNAQECEWVCDDPSCGQAYDLVYIENQLVNIVKQQVHAYQLQDLKCVKCKQIESGVCKPFEKKGSKNSLLSGKR